jgi:hypothetical protein
MNIEYFESILLDERHEIPLIELAELAGRS